MFKINDYVVYKRDVCQIIGIKDEKYLYNELSISLNMNYEEVKKYVFDTVSSIKK